MTKCFEIAWDTKELTQLFTINGIPELGDLIEKRGFWIAMWWCWIEGKERVLIVYPYENGWVERGVE